MFKKEGQEIDFTCFFLFCIEEHYGRDKILMQFLIGTLLSSAEAFN